MFKKLLRQIQRVIPFKVLRVKGDSLILKTEKDITLAPHIERQWVEIGVFAVCLIRTDEGVVVDVYANGCEMEETLASTYAFSQDAEAIQALV